MSLVLFIYLFLEEWEEHITANVQISFLNDKFVLATVLFLGNFELLYKVGIDFNFLR